MRDDPITELYVLADDGETFEGINPTTVAKAVEDEANNDTVQKFIDNGITDWNQVQTGKEYVTSNLVYETFNTLENGFNQLNKDSFRYKAVWDATNQSDFSNIDLPVKKGYSYKVIGNETTIGNRTFKPGDFIIINRDVEKTDIINNEDVDLLLGYGNEGLGVNRVVSDVFETKATLDLYTDGRKNSIVIVANDETHGNLLSFYEYDDEAISFDKVVNSYNDLLNISTIDVIPQYLYNYTIDSNNTYIITLNKYIDTLTEIPAPQIIYIESGYIVKVLNDETKDNKTTFYKWDGISWIYVGDTSSNWKYLFSYKDYSRSDIDNMISTIYTNLNNIRNDISYMWFEFDSIQNKLMELDNRVTDLENR